MVIIFLIIFFRNIIVAIFIHFYIRLTDFQPKCERNASVNSVAPAYDMHITKFIPASNVVTECRQRHYLILYLLLHGIGDPWDKCLREVSMYKVLYFYMMPQTTVL